LDTLSVSRNVLRDDPTFTFNETHPMEWKPHITVATVVEDNGRFLMVEELKRERAVLNQPAGHLDPDESLIDAAIRETLEETGYDVEADRRDRHLPLHRPQQRRDLPAHLLCRQGPQAPPDYKLDTGIIGPLWLTRDELLAQRDRWRSELTLQCIDDYLGGKLFDLTLIRPSV
jgi:8-oxo-dGTP pyrophosphatase MutT (NUDIX family)